MSNENKRAIVIGASRGIGFGLVRQLLNQHWDVIATVRDKNQRSKDLDRLLADYPESLTLIDVDLADLQTVDNLLAIHPDLSVDLLLISAGIAGPEHQRVELCTQNDITDLFWVNSIAPVAIARKLLSRMKEKSVIAFMSSIMGSIALNDDGSMEIYRASKAALNSITRGFAQNEAIPLNVGVLNLHPGWVQTEMGGRNAPVTIDESTKGLVNVIEKFRGHYEHKFIDFKGQEITW